MTTGSFTFAAKHRRDLTDVDVLDLYAPLIDSCGLGSIVRYRLVSFDIGTNADGTFDELRARLEKGAPGGFSIETDAGFHLGFVHLSGTEEWSAWHSGIKLDRPMLLDVVGLCEKLFRLADPPSSIRLSRDERDLRVFPRPPIAEQCHVVTTTEVEVAAAYDDARVFWAQWDHVYESGERRLCIRASKDVDIENYLGRTFEGNFELARHARPHLTKYGLADARLLKKLDSVYGAVWTLGPHSEEKAGMPALTFVGHDINADVFHYTGLIERDGKEERGRVQLREIYEVHDRCYTDAGDAAPGRVHVLFLDEWMARQERRPLRDVGARVFFYAKDGTKVEVTD